MSQVYLVVDCIDDWAPYYPSEQVMSFDQYVGFQASNKQRIRVINLCRELAYLEVGYYCSLLAEARGHHVIPSVRVLNDLSTPQLYQLQLHQLGPELNKISANIEGADNLIIKSYFGSVSRVELAPLARSIFDLFPCPIVEITFDYHDDWAISSLRILGHQILTDAEQTEFANALDIFSKQIWRQRKARKGARYDLAILHNPDESMPPSNAEALRRFAKAGRSLGIEVELITPSDFIRLAEFDALFIRETTAIDHHTYQFAQRAEAEGMVVMDDPNSILRCTNKIYLADLFMTHKIPTPRTMLLKRGDPEQLDAIAQQLGLPMIVKIPDGSFSRGVVKVDSLIELHQKTEVLFEKTSLLLAQEYLFTEYDWRIGILNHRPLYACRYYMVKDHWQIYRHGTDDTTDSGNFRTMPTFEVPRHVLQASIKATKHIGSGLYGVDIKELSGKAYVIEVNDNPSIEHGVEDAYLHDELYMQVMSEFYRRMEARGR